MACVLMVDTLILCLERPDINPNGIERQIVDVLDVVCELLFTVEMIVKISVQGAWSHPNSDFKQRYVIATLPVFKVAPKCQNRKV